MDFHSKILDPQRQVRFYGSTPPRAGSSPSDVERAADGLLERVGPLGVDGLVVYDVQDESDRTSAPRPFPFAPTMDTRAYSQVLEARSGLPIVTYKCVGQASEPEWDAWLQESAEIYGVRQLSLVGRASSRGASSDWISLSRATQMAQERGFLLGGVAIAERHTAQRSESHKIIQKTRNGCSFFISQAIYRPEATVQMLRDYQADCREMSLAPQRMVLTFTPCGNAKILGFLRWLGVEMDAGTEREILESPSPLSKSIEICALALSRILSHESCKYLPLGINVESVSSRKEESDAASDLFHALTDVMQSHSSAL